MCCQKQINSDFNDMFLFLFLFLFLWRFFLLENVFTIFCFCGRHRHFVCTNNFHTIEHKNSFSETLENDKKNPPSKNSTFLSLYCILSTLKKVIFCNVLLGIKYVDNASKMQSSFSRKLLLHFFLFNPNVKWHHLMHFSFS